ATIYSTGHTAPAGSVITPSSDGKGVFMYRSANGNGTNNWTNTELVWDYGADGVPDDASIEVNVLAIEMVYIPEGDFYIGDGDGTNEATNSFHNSWSNYAVQITSAPSDPIKVDVNSYDDDPIEIDGVIVDGDGGLGNNADFPTGYKAFYMMKYEISQEQYCDFLNMLTRTQQISRVNTNITGTNITNIFVMSGTTTPTFRNAIRCNNTIPASPTPVTFYLDLDNDGVPDEGCDGKNIPCNYLTYMDEAAYADWAGLRIMTELEYEKASRGPNNRVYGEFAWGSTAIHNAAYSLQNNGCPGEILASLPQNIGNANYSTTYGTSPLRCGIFAASSVNHTRLESGAGYYGVMELSGNLVERVVHLGSAAGRSYRGIHGNGSLTSEGFADVDYWPGINGNSNTGNSNQVYLGVQGCTAAAGSGWRGGAYGNTLNHLQISHRGNAGNPTTTRFDTHGSRFVRTAP
ncbi:MAG: SUMF1/EgtB/PvdO family nonheme iron enzyme, partial [Bacteroidales bacterium]|nr:SUMF1/EgtB/PvdO family nonheme iron enzyme [Bacteroidales bacterium]